MGDRQQFQDLGVVVEHLFKMRHMPFGVDAVARKSPADVIVNAACTERVEQAAHRVAIPGRRRGVDIRCARNRKIGALGNLGARPDPAVERVGQAQ